jgi:6-pyruvoyltetrahydropterin/6-carboxytetrahydropterin synthase
MSGPAITLTRAYRFAAAHYYRDPALSDPENERVFGKCANPHGHGHNYRVEIALRGTPEPRTGMLLDLRTLDAVVHERVLLPLDHKHLNLQVPFFAARQPTCENVAVWVWDALADALPAGLLHQVRVSESEDLAAEYRGPGPAPA